MAHEKDETAFDRFLKLNEYYEVTYVKQQFIIGADLWAENKKTIEVEQDEDDDDYDTKIAAINAAL
jgi:hypothetical protein